MLVTLSQKYSEIFMCCTISVWKCCSWRVHWVRFSHSSSNLSGTFPHFSAFAQQLLEDFYSFNISIADEKLTFKLYFCEVLNIIIVNDISPRITWPQEKGEDGGLGTERDPWSARLRGIFSRPCLYCFLVLAFLFPLCVVFFSMSSFFTVYTHITLCRPFDLAEWLDLGMLRIAALIRNNQYESSMSEVSFKGRMEERRRSLLTAVVEFYRPIRYHTV